MEVGNNVPVFVTLFGCAMVVLGMVAVPHLIKSRYLVSLFPKDFIWIRDYAVAWQEWLPKVGSVILGVGYALHAIESRKKQSSLNAKNVLPLTWCVLGLVSIITVVILLCWCTVKAKESKPKIGLCDNSKVY